MAIKSKTKTTAPVRRTTPLAATRTATRPALPTTNGVASKVMLITPELAEEWLGRNSHNRPIRQRTVDDLAAAIERGEWIMNGDSIRFSVTNVLLDGQHRLWAIFQAGKAVESLVVTGLPNDAQETMDVGARRSLKDTLQLRGYTNSGKVASALNYLWRYRNGYVRFSSAKPTIAQAVTLLDGEPTFLDWIRDTNKVLDRFRLSGSMLAVAFYEFANLDEADARVFLEKLVSGVNLDAHDPIHVLRKHFERQAVSSVGARASAAQSHALMIKAWNAWRLGEQIEKLQWKTTGATAESFPVPV